MMIGRETITAYTPLSYLTVKYGTSLIADDAPRYVTISIHILTTLASTAIAAPIGSLYHGAKSIYHLILLNANFYNNNNSEENKHYVKLHAKAASVDFVAFLSFLSLSFATSLFIHHGPLLGFKFALGSKSNALSLAAIGSAIFIGIFPIGLVYSTMIERIDHLKWLNKHKHSTQFSESYGFYFCHDVVERSLKRSDYWLNTSTE